MKGVTVFELECEYKKSPGFSPGRVLGLCSCIMKVMYPHSASLHPEVLMNTI